MNFMLAATSVYLLTPDGWFDLYVPFLVMAVMIILVIAIFVRQGRHAVLEEIVANDDLGPPEAFRRTLVVEENRPGSYLRLRNSSRAARAWHFWYRWVAGAGPQANVDEVTFDASLQQVELSKKEKHTTFRFSEIAAIRLRERGAGKSGSTWYLELIPCEGKPVPFATSAIGDRQTMFERTAAVAKAAARIAAVPVQVIVAGNVWTSGWPPKKRVAAR
ncbi:MAG: hypothetical protein WB460_08015 [Candidatus Acidiferrales bacterium]